VTLHDVLRYLGIRDLRTFADAWDVEVIRRDDRDEYVDLLRQSKHKVLDESHVKPKLSFDDLPYRVHMLVRWVLRELLNTPGYVVPVDAFHEALVHEEEELIAWASNPRALQHLDKRVVEIYKTVLDAAWEDGDINTAEYNLIEKLRQKLGITRRDHRVIEAQMGRFPSKSGRAHSVEEIEGAAGHLSRHGLLLRFKGDDGARVYCVPEELGGLLRQIYGIELVAPNYRSLLAQVPVAAIRSALEEAGQPFSGTREFLAARAVDGYVSPRTVLRQLNDDQLANLLRGLPGIRQDGSKEIRVRSIVKYYDRLRVMDEPDGATDNRVSSYITYYTDLARRSYDLLHATNVISRDGDIERAFEEATTALFSQYLGHTVATMAGSNHPDGRIDLDPSNRVILWDCKSCESPYALTERGSRQFLDYAAATDTRVASPLLVIAPEFTPESVTVAHKLKTNCRPGTEIALVTADDLKWLAELWQKRGKGSLPWQVLAVTGRLTRDVIEDRLRSFAQTR